MSLLHTSKAVFEWIKDGIAPPRCAGCRKLGEWACWGCRQSILFLKQQNCYRCGRLVKGGRTCGRCQRHSSLTGTVVALYFQHGAVRELVHTLKYDGVVDLAELLGEAMAYSWQTQPMMVDLVASVPMYAKRLAQRGFNQSELLARHVARKIGVEYQNVFERKRNTISQTGLNRRERSDNVKGAFVAKGVVGKRILLVDDVMTTGATLEECARVARDEGAKQIWGLVVARG